MLGENKPFPVERARQLRQIGFEHIIFNNMGDYSKERMKYLTDELAPAINEL